MQIQMILRNDFSDFHGVSPIQASTKKDELQIQERLYIKLSTTKAYPIHTD